MSSKTQMDIFCIFGWGIGLSIPYFLAKVTSKSDEVFICSERESMWGLCQCSLVSYGFLFVFLRGREMEPRKF